MLHALHMSDTTRRGDGRKVARKDITRFLFTLDNAPARAAREFKSYHDMQSTSAEQRAMSVQSLSVAAALLPRFVHVAL